jgi:hypothetical protein
MLTKHYREMQRQAEVVTIKEQSISLTSIDTDQLLQMYANAYETSSCGGHYKGRRNEELMTAYATELEVRGIIVAKTFLDLFDDEFQSNVELPKGVFNGKGSY